MNKIDKIVSIQYLRGLAALGVVFCHFGLFSYGQLGVPVFFLISGFIIVHSMQESNYRPNQFFIFLLKRSVRIDPAYWIVIMLWIGLFYFLNALPTFRGEHFVFNPGQLLAHLLYIVPFAGYKFYNQVFWTLCVEFQFYLLIGLLFFLSSSKLHRAVFVIAFALITFLPLPNGYYLISTYSPIFATGIALLIYYKDRKLSNAILPALLLTLVAYKFGLPTFILLLASCCAILFVEQRVKPLYFLGNISYSLYLTHPLIGEISLGVFKRIGFDSPQHPILAFTIELTAAILFAWGFYLLVERPFIRLSKHIIYQRTNHYPVKGWLARTR